jgi:hypothetical protein
MATNSISTFVSEASQPVVRAVVDGRRIARFLHLFHLVSAWLARRRKKTAALVAAADYEAGDERFDRDNGNRIYAARLGGERVIDLHTVIQRLTLNR